MWFSHKLHPKIRLTTMPFSAQTVDLAYLPPPPTPVPTENSGNLFPSKMLLAFSKVIIPQLGGVNLLYRQRYNQVPVTACPLTPCVLVCDMGQRLDGWAGTCKYSVGGLRHVQWKGEGAFYQRPVYSRVLATHCKEQDCLLLLHLSRNLCC